jgi:hypothetical protein
VNAPNSDRALAGDASVRYSVFMRDVGKISIDELIRRALEFHGQGLLTQAEPLYRQALQSSPNHPVRCTCWACSAAR